MARLFLRSFARSEAFPGILLCNRMHSDLVCRNLIGQGTGTQ